MARKSSNAPGLNSRNGISLIEIFRMFPDDATAEQWFIQQRWPNGIACPRCGPDNVNPEGQASNDAAPLSLLPQAIQREVRHGDAGQQAWIPDMGHSLLFGYDESEGYIQHEAAS